MSEKFKLKEDGEVKSNKKNEKQNEEQKKEYVKITPKKDWILNTGREVIEIQEGVSVSIPKPFEISLKTEGVI